MTRRITLLDGFVLAAVILVGLIHLPYPFDGDQALFTVGSSKIYRGATLYRDFWDLKQPGIFGFYLLGGMLFGFTEIGIHAFELLYMLTLAMVLRFTLSKHFENKAIASLLPLLTVGIYYCVVRSWHLTQVEGLVGLPMFLCAWLAAEATQKEKGRTARCFFSGLTGGIVLLFKFLFLPIVLSFWISAVAYVLFSKRTRISAIASRIFAPLSLGIILPLAAAFLYFAQLKTLGLLNYTFFEYPSRAIAEIPGWRLGSLVKGIFWFLTNFVPLTALTWVWIYSTWSKPREMLLKNPLFWNLLLWLIVGFGVILLQRLSWWDYHFMLFFVPLGILATKGLDILWAAIKEFHPSLSSKSGRVAASIVSLLLFSSALVSLGYKTMDLASHGFALGREKRLKYQSEVSDGYRTAIAETEFLSQPESRRGGIFVAGNPIYYYLSGRDQAVASNGWMLELYLPEQWNQLTDELSNSRPPYLFIGSEYETILPERGPGTASFINSTYEVLRKSPAGTWYVLRTD